MKIPLLIPDFRDSEILRNFSAREATSIALGVFWGAVASAIIRAGFLDNTFHAYIVSLYSQPLSHFSDDGIYLEFGCIAAAALLLFLSLRYYRLFDRAGQSWIHGVTSGIRTLSCVTTIAVLTLVQIPLRYRIIGSIAVFAGGFFISALLCLRAEQARKSVPPEEAVCVSKESRRIAGSDALESDDPICTWEEDTLGRSSLVDAISIRILVSRSPVIALYGEFGSGKTSILNLLREHLIEKAIVIVFNTWLPGSQETLTSYLMSDIASECQKNYIVPGLRSSTSRFARALGKSLPMFKGLPELLPSNTQRDDIVALQDLLTRLPKRVVVLLDELDRMDKQEIRTLLKVVRGVSSLPNLSFVCAAEQKSLLDAMTGDTPEERNLYFEKFFPVVIQVPKLDKADLKRAGIERIISSLRTRNWFALKTEEEEFQKRLLEIWELRVSPYCGTLRAIGLLANDVAGAAAPLRREVDAIDLVLVELLKRFELTIYDLVSRNGLALTGGEGVFRGGIYYSDEERKRDLDRFREAVSNACGDHSRLKTIQSILGELFLDYAKAEDLRWLQRPKRKDREPSNRRISDADIFPAYFRYELPKAIFSSLNLERFIKESSCAKDERQREEIFREEFSSMGRGSLIRDDFLRKLDESATKVDLQVAKSWVFAALSLATDLTYDMLAAFGESGYCMRRSKNRPRDAALAA